MGGEIYYGGKIEVLRKAGDMVTVGGPGLVFDDPEGDDSKGDLYGEWFGNAPPDFQTYLGAHKGNGMDVLFHHGFELGWWMDLEPEGAYARSKLADNVWGQAKAQVDDDGLAIMTEVTLDMRDDYERWIADMCSEGKMGWSSGAVQAKRGRDGYIRSWIIGEWSITPTPAEPRTTAMPMKSLGRMRFDDDLVKGFKSLGKGRRLIVPAGKPSGKTEDKKLASTMLELTMLELELVSC